MGVFFIILALSAIGGGYSYITHQQTCSPQTPCGPLKPE